jgi:hypothetical protein
VFVVTLLIDLLHDRRFPLQNTPSYDELDVWYQEIRSILKHPAFERVLAEIRDLPPIEALPVAFTRLTPKALAAEGVPIREGTIITILASQEAIGPLISPPDGPILRISADFCLPTIPPRWIRFLVIGEVGYDS